MGFWNAVERRSLDDLKELRTNMILDLNFYSKILVNLKKNFKFLEVAKDLLSKKYDLHYSLIKDYEGTINALHEVYLIVLKWISMMEK